MPIAGAVTDAPLGLAVGARPAFRGRRGRSRRLAEPHVSADQLAAQLGVAKTTMANKAARILKALDVGVFEPELSRRSILEQHPLTWMVEVNGFLVDARALPTEVQDEARRRGLIPDVEDRRAA